MKLILIVLMLFVSIRGELRLRPSGKELKKRVGESLVLTCEWESDEMEGEEEEEGDGRSIKWFDPSNAEVVEMNTGTNKYVEADNGDVKKLYLNSIEMGDDGVYRCEREGRGGEKEVKGIQLRIFKEVVFQKAPATQHPVQGSDAVITCEATAYPPPVVSWQKGKRKLPGKHTHKYKQTAEGLMIEDISKSDNGVYVCRAEVMEEAMYDDRRIEVDVYVPPVITEGLSNVVGLEGEDMVVECKGEGYPTPSFHFYKDDGAKLESSDRIKVDEMSASLTFSPLMEGDAGRYVCKGVNEAGEVSTNGTVVVNVQPVVTFPDVVNTENQPVHLDCKARAVPSATFTFVKVGEEERVFEIGNYVDDGIEIYMNQDNDVRLSIKQVQPQHAGLYRCTAQNSVGRNDSSASLTVNYKPKFLENQSTELFIWAGKTKNLSCLVDAVPPPTIKWTHLGKLIIDDASYSVFDLSDSKSVLQIEATEENLKSLLDGITCEAGNEYGLSQLKTNVKEATSPSAPENILITETFSTGFLITIKPPSNDGGETLLGYQVDCEEQTTTNIDVNIAGNISPYNPPYQINPSTVASVGLNLRKISHLEPNKTYQIKVRARNEVGLGRPLTLKATTTSIRKPFPIKLNPVADDSFSRYLVKWEEPNTGGRAIEELEFQYRRKPADDVTEHHWVTESMTLERHNTLGEFLLDGLDSNSAYQIQSRARNEIGWSEFGPIAEFQTRTTTPQEQSLKHASVSRGLIFFIVLLLLLLLLLLVDLCCFRFNECGVTHHLLSRLRGDAVKSSEKERVVEDGEKECLKENDSLPKPTIVYETVDENGVKIDLNKEDTA